MADESLDPLDDATPGWGHTQSEVDSMTVAGQQEDQRINEDLHMQERHHEGTPAAAVFEAGDFASHMADVGGQPAPGYPGGLPADYQTDWNAGVAHEGAGQDTMSQGQPVEPEDEHAAEYHNDARHHPPETEYSTDPFAPIEPGIEPVP